MMLNEERMKNLHLPESFICSTFVLLKKKAWIITLNLKTGWF
jgi:hypothetical protein